ncbi:MAG: hypothetical protein ACRCZF_07940 [Gemmataceae bacterium]
MIHHVLVCPCCQAKNENAANPSCRRCQADLAPLWELEQLRSEAIAQVRVALSVYDAKAARQWLMHAQTLRPGPDLVPWNALLALLERDFSTAWTTTRPGGC